MSWYYVDATGNTQGPLGVDVMKSHWGSSSITQDTYVWNGADVNQWTPLKNVPQLLKQLKPNKPQQQQQKYPVPPPNIKSQNVNVAMNMNSNSNALRAHSREGAAGAPKRRRKSLFGGGKKGRANLLSSIRSGTTLKKFEPANNVSAGTGSGSGSKSIAAGSGFKKKLTLQEQMKQRLAARGAKGNTFAHLEKKQSVQKKMNSKPEPSWKKKTNPKPESSSPQMSWKSKSKWNKGNNTVVNKKSNPIVNNNNKNNKNKNDDNLDYRNTKIMNALKVAQEWQLKAVEKILGV